MARFDKPNDDFLVHGEMIFELYNHSVDVFSAGEGLHTKMQAKSDL